MGAPKPAKVVLAVSLFLALAVAPALATCPTRVDVGKGVWLDYGGTWLLRVQTVVETGFVVELRTEDSRRIGFASHYAHPLLFGETFMKFTASKRSYEQSVSSLDDLEQQKEWQSGFTIQDGDKEALLGTVTVEFQKNRIERVGTCKYKVWEVLVREHVSGDDERTVKVLYSPELKIVLKQAHMLPNSGLVWGRGFDGIRSKSE
ncbi:hypothetical protein [Ruegeria faecimaris]|uniref:Group 4 capsule polysaccharide lipoprotein gfcB, YjbF n=1 Tax=Ruegeria faecimaris TaxID=686389 RepID=A0A521F3T8_9RHOB|nr:hypothetical protein [Ruegeria faecimaris]SMO90837.1 hypothetical protein SAMN06265380_11676 [Ruegeria faecimaris]